MGVTASDVKPIVATGTVKESDELTFFNTITQQNMKISAEHYSKLQKENYPLTHLDVARPE